MSKRNDIELAKLRAAAPTSVAAFASARRNRIATLVAVLATLPEDEPPQDPSVEDALRAARGGDRFGR